MFGFKRAAVEEPARVMDPPKKPVILAPHKGVIRLGAYENLAGELGFMPAQLLEEQLRQFLAENNIPTYGYQEVDSYLTHMARQEKKKWIWRPLREQDKPQGWQWGGHDEPDETHSFNRGHGSYKDEWAYRPYDKAVPIHILQRVKKIQDRFQNKVLFFVSDYAVPNPDPFIMVTALDVNRLVFGVWDEPAFDTEAKSSN